MSRKEPASPPPKTHPVAKPVIAIEFDGKLYPSFQSAEGARAKADLVSLLVPSVRDTFPHNYMIDAGKRDAIDGMIDNAERVHGILSRYLDAAKIETPTTAQ